jgi:hypothetical protein
VAGKQHRDPTDKSQMNEATMATVARHVAQMAQDNYAPQGRFTKGHGSIRRAVGALQNLQSGSVARGAKIAVMRHCGLSRA